MSLLVERTKEMFGKLEETLNLAVKQSFDFDDLAKMSDDQRDGLRSVYESVKAMEKYYVEQSEVQDKLTEQVCSLKGKMNIMDEKINIILEKMDKAE